MMKINSLVIAFVKTTEGIFVMKTTTKKETPVLAFKTPNGGFMLSFKNAAKPHQPRRHGK